ncbi:MAG: PA14 domain-containing protein [Cytophagales bacterium]|nr:PA14 domain-containing protein [Cytophagales bacterium]
MKRNVYLSYTLLILTWLSSLTSFAQCVGTSGEVTWNLWLGYNTFQDSVDMVHDEYYPEYPNHTLKLGSLSTPYNYSDYYASMIRGYIAVPQTGSYYFNLAGDDDVQFYLSTDESKANLQRKAYVDGWTYPDEHYKETNQTSGLTQLIGGRNYYFEIHHYEGGWQDHINLYWRKPSVPDTDTLWQIIDYNYIKDYACGGNCPPRGTACDDGDPLSFNDQQDGFCNCAGSYPPPNSSVGEKGLVEAYYFDDIPGTYVENDLINSPKFPLLPDRKEKLKGAYGPLESYTNDEYGSLVQGYLTVPETGIYEFNLTGDNQTFFYLSSNENPENKQAHQALVFYGLGEGEHVSSSFQTIGPLTLEKGKFYYYEIRHKENGWRDFFHVHWKTPFHDNWKLIPKFYLYDFADELSCMAQGAICDDGDPYTANDQYDANCNCVGTPCSGPDCDDSMARYSFYEECASTDNLVPSEEYSWVSCGSTGPNPNPARSSSTHWIKYDFQNQYKLQNSRIWNYNVLGQTNKGFRTVKVDYSIDGINWTALGGTYNWPMAPGTSDYAGFAGPNFSNIKARYILISAVSNWGSTSCSGFSKITFDAIHCDDKDTPCDDGDPLTSYDKFDDNCNCRGVDINCASDTLLLAKSTLIDDAFSAKMRIQSESLVPNTENISFTAGNSIVLLPGFEVKRDAVFSAKIEDCIRAAFEENEFASLSNKVSESRSILSDDESRENIKKIIFRLSAPGHVKLSLLNSKGETMVVIIDNDYEILGTHMKYLPTNRLSKGRYVIELNIDGNVVKEQFDVE